MYLVSKLLIKMKFDSQRTRNIANQFLRLAYRSACSEHCSVLVTESSATTGNTFLSLIVRIVSSHRHFLICNDRHDILLFETIQI